MPRKEHPEFGPVNERTFPASALDADSGLRATLEDFKHHGRICDYRIENGTLTLWRPWIEGKTQEEYFRSLLRQDRIKLSRQLFQRLREKLDQMGHGHGALHPRNIILRDVGGSELTDERFNTVRLHPYAISKRNIWLWGPCLPEGWSVKDWDRVSLLRTAVLLSEGPASWEVPVAQNRVADLAREWAGDFGRSLVGGPDSEPEIRAAVTLLESIVGAAFNLPTLPPAQETTQETCDAVKAEKVLRREIQSGLLEARRLIQKGKRREAQELLDEIFS
jgi:hypothetical protein